MPKTINKELPDVLQAFIADYPEVWDAYNRLGEVATQSGPLDEKTQRLVKLAIAIGSGRQGAVRSHTKRALKAGASMEEVIQVGILAIASIGWSGAFAAITWIQEVVPPSAKPGARKKLR